MDKWICKRCGKELFEKPKKNYTCECKGRYRHFTTCKICGEWFYNGLNCKTMCDKCGSPQARHARVRETLVCENCGKVFERRISSRKGENQKTYCSKECMKEHKAGIILERTCKYCGKTFTVKQSSIGKTTNASGNYCSSRCYWDSMTIDGDKCYKGFRPAKHKYFDGVQFCIMCGTTKNIHIHHIIPNRLTHDQSKDNLIPICTHCHPKVERITREVLKVCKDYKVTKFYLNNILRTKQYATFAVIKAVMDKRKAL